MSSPAAQLPSWESFFISLLDRFHCLLCSHIYFIRFPYSFARDPPGICPHMSDNVSILPFHLTKFFHSGKKFETVLLQLSVSGVCQILPGCFFFPSNHSESFGCCEISHDLSRCLIFMEQSVGRFCAFICWPLSYFVPGLITDRTSLTLGIFNIDNGWFIQ